MMTLLLLQLLLLLLLLIYNLSFHFAANIGGESLQFFSKQKCCEKVLQYYYKNVESTFFFQKKFNFKMFKQVLIMF